jgi:hypothetical protein
MPTLKLTRATDSLPQAFFDPKSKQRDPISIAKEITPVVCLISNELPSNNPLSNPKKARCFHDLSKVPVKANAAKRENVEARWL